MTSVELSRLGARLAFLFLHHSVTPTASTELSERDRGWTLEMPMDGP